jgi:DNA-binding transcriptional ArsR family regulator
MDAAEQLANLSAQLADPARAAIVLSLMDGGSQPTGALQISASVSASSASNHLSRLVDAGVLTVAKRGRLKYYRIATAAVAHAIEALSVVASPAAAIQMAARSPINPFSFARTCYDHLAGKLGVEIAVALLREDFIRPAGKHYEVTEAGYGWLDEMGIHCAQLRLQRRSFASQCLDFTERRHHLSGALGAVLLARMIEQGWLLRSRVPRAVRLTAKGKIELGKRLHLDFTHDHNVKYKGNGSKPLQAYGSSESRTFWTQDA